MQPDRSFARRLSVAGLTDKGGPAVAEHNKTEDSERELLRALLSGPAVGVPHHADEETRTTFTERRQAQMEAYGQWVATSPIYVPGSGILAFNVGAQVPIEHVEKWNLELAGVVARVATPELARAGRRFSAHEGGQLPPGSGGGTDVLVDPLPAATPPAPPGEEAADADEGGISESKPRKSTTAAKTKNEGAN